MVFEDVWSNSTYTRESVASILSGRLPSRAGAYGWNTRLPAANPNLAHLGNAAGHRTLFFTNHPNLGTPPYTNWLGFDHEDHSQRGYASGRGMRLTRTVLQALEADRESPFVAYVQYLDPHAPYAPPDDCRRRLGDAPLQDAMGFIRIRQNLPALKAEGFGPGHPQFEDMVQRYDAEILHTDDCIRALVEGLDRLGLAENTLVVVTADHGEEFLEHGFVDHAWTVYRETLQVPLILFWPRHIAPARVETPIALVDLLPTLHTVLGNEIPRGTFDGQPLLQWRGEHLEPAASSRPVMAQLLIQERCLVQALRDGDASYIAWQRFVAPDNRPAASDNRLELTRALSRGELASLDVASNPIREEWYNLRHDPGQQHDLAREDATTLARLRDTWRTMLADSGVALPEASDPDELSPADQEALEALGYA